MKNLPVFPIQACVDAEGRIAVPMQPGIGLLEFWAAAALTGYRAANVHTGGAYPGENSLQSSSRVAKWSFDDAVAMLEEFERRTKPITPTPPGDAAKEKL